MKKLLILVALISSVTYSQENFYTFDMSEFLSEMEKPWSIGNGTNPVTGEFEGPYFEVIVYGGMNMNNHHLEIMNTKITVQGDTINSGEVTKRFFAISDLIVEGETLSTPEQELFELSMFPNPARDFVTLRGQFMEKVQIYDMNGKLINRLSPMSDDFEIDLRNFAEGMYLLKIFMSDNRGTFKKLIVNGL